MKKIHFLGLGLLALVLMGPAHAAPILTDSFHAESSGNTLAKRGDSVQFVHHLQGLDLATVAVENAQIKLTFSGGTENWTDGRFDLWIGDDQVRKNERFAEFITIQVKPEWIRKALEQGKLSGSIERANAAGSTTFLNSELGFWGSGGTSIASGSTADATPVPTPGTLFLLAAGLLGAVSPLRRRLR